MDEFRRAGRRLVLAMIVSLALWALAIGAIWQAVRGS